MNQCLLEGVVRGLGNETVDVVLDPIPGQCCIRLSMPGRAAPPPRGTKRNEPAKNH